MSPNKIDKSMPVKHRSKSNNVIKSNTNLDGMMVGSSAMAPCPVPPSCPHRSISRKTKSTNKKSRKKTQVNISTSSPARKKNQPSVGRKISDESTMNDEYSNLTHRELVQRIGKCQIVETTNVNTSGQTKDARSRKSVSSSSEKKPARKKPASAKDSAYNVKPCLSSYEVTFVSYERMAKKLSENEKFLSSNDDTSSGESTDESIKERTNEYLGPKSNLVRNIEAVKVENKPKTRKKHGKSRKYRTKIVRGAPRVGHALTPATKEKVAREQARVAVEELCRQASAARIAIKPQKGQKSLSPALSPCSMFREFKEKVEKGKGKKELSPSKVSFVTYPSTGLKDCQSLQTLPRTYQQLGLSPLQRSPSSKNFFPNMAAFLRGEDGNIPAVRSPPKLWDSRHGRQNNASSSQGSGSPTYRAENLLQVGTEGGARRPPRKRSIPRNTTSCIQPRRLISFKKASQSFHNKGMVLQQSILPLFSKGIGHYS